MIVFSGIDCSGKSTQIELLKEYMIGKNLKPIVIWTRGGYTGFVEFIKNLYRRDKKYSDLERDQYRKNQLSSPGKNRLLLFISILDLIRVYAIKFRLIEFLGRTIIADRYLWDTYIDFKLKFANVEFERWISWKLLVVLSKKPKTSIILTIPARVSMERSELKFEPFPETYDERVKRIGEYVKEISKNRWDYVINSEVSITDVHKKIIKIIEKE